MFSTTTRFALVLTAVTLAHGALPARASVAKAYLQVREGIRLFAKGDFEGAQRAFSEADVALPENDRILFDRACAHLAQQDAEKAAELFRQTSQSRDPRVAAASHYNLGGIAVVRARALFGDQPADASPEVRQKGIGHLGTAISHYRDCLDITPDHPRARKNLEVLRLWLKHMQDVWSERDREQQRSEMNLLELLEMITNRQHQLHQLTVALDREPDSPRRRQAVREAGRSQRELAEEVDALKEKADQSLQAAPGPVAGSDPGQAEQASAAFHALADRSVAAIVKAAENLDAAELTAAAESQLKALETLNEIYTAVAPFQHLLQKSITVQETLVSQSQTTRGAGQTEDEDAVREQQATAPMLDEQEDVNWQRLEREQTLVDGWCFALPQKAQAELDQLAAQPPANPPAGPPAPQSPQNPPQVHQMQPEEMKAALQKAIELAPEAQKHASLAVDALGEENATTALPNQQEALRLLKEIAEQLPKQPPQDQGQDDQQQDDQQNQGQNQEPQEPQQNPDPQSSDEQNQQPQPEQQRAESVLRKAKQRERDYRDRQKRMQALIRGAIEVDRDW